VIEKIFAPLAAAGHTTTVGEAFLLGYRAALARLVPSLPAGRVTCLCATEEGGAKPSAIRTRLFEADGWRVDGKKKWITGGESADLLLVVASLGQGEDGRNRLKVAVVEARQPGVVQQPMPPTPFVPEIPHAEVEFHEARVLEVLPGDGYTQYLKPFRTIEDTHVFAAVLAHLAGAAARHGWPRPFSERVAAVLAALSEISRADPLAAGTHIQLAGALALGKQLADEAATLFDGDERARWQRDQVLLSVAQKARDARTHTAWAELSK
jgi:alkylation response protein AidB-like acyl-CoA dehydrogenase